jgi:hypothetical protein
MLFQFNFFHNVSLYSFGCRHAYFLNLNPYIVVRLVCLLL